MVKPLVGTRVSIKDMNTNIKVENYYESVT
jgi:hypothetical protein